MKTKGNSRFKILIFSGFMLGFCLLCVGLPVAAATNVCNKGIENNRKPNNNQDIDPKSAASDFNSGNFRAALPKYEALYASDANNTDYAYRLAVCYLNTFTTREKAIPLLLKATSDSKFKDIMAWYELGRAYQATHQFDEAIKAFGQYKRLASGKENLRISSDRQIAMCNNAKELIAYPVNVRFENLGPEINSEAPDFNAFVPIDESFIMFTSKRESNIGRTMDYDGYNTADVYWNTLKNGKYTKTRNMGPVINSALIEEITGLSTDGEVMIMYFENYSAEGDVFFSNRRGRSFQKPEPFFFPVNTTELETAAAFSPTKDTLYFASVRKGGKGAGDIYSSIKLPNGDWSTPVPVDVLNTEEDENHPYVSPCGQFLYFASTGHNSMGGYDIFRAKWNPQEKKWGSPVNMGYPINTTDDNTYLCFGRGRHYAYTSAIRPEGYGHLDIYKVYFLDEQPLYSLIEAKLCGPDSSELQLYVEPELAAIKEMLANPKIKATQKDSIFTMVNKDTIFTFNITATDTTTKTVSGIYQVTNPEGIFFIYLPTGAYYLTIEGKGAAYRQLLVIHDKERYQDKFKKTILLSNKLGTDNEDSPEEETE